MDYVYSQGIHLKVNQLNIHLFANLFHATSTKYPQPSCDAMLTILILVNPPLPLQDPIIQTSYFPMSLEVAPCQEDSQKHKAINFKKDQDQEPFHLLQEIVLPYPMSYQPPKYDEYITSTISIELTENYEKISLHMC